MQYITKMSLQPHSINMHAESDMKAQDCSVCALTLHALENGVHAFKVRTVLLDS